MLMLLGLAIGLTLSLTATCCTRPPRNSSCSRRGEHRPRRLEAARATSRPPRCRPNCSFVNSAPVQSARSARSLAAAPSGVSAAQVSQTNVVALTAAQPEFGARRADRQRVRQCLRRLVHRDGDQQPGRGGEPAERADQRDRQGSSPKPRLLPQLTAGIRALHPAGGAPGGSSLSSRWPGPPRRPGARAGHARRSADLAKFTKARAGGAPRSCGRVDRRHRRGLPPRQP